MRRESIPPRDDWRRLVASQGLLFHTIEGETYWDEGAYYCFESAEVDRIEEATYRLNEMCLEAVEHVIAKDLFAFFEIPPRFVEYVVNSWESEEHTIYGRFDLSYDGSGPPKLLEYNADTPTALLESAVIQWTWYKDRFDGSFDQFNSIHERLIEAWSAVGEDVVGRVHFASLEDNLEDFMTASYLRDTAIQAGLDTAPIDVGAIGWNHRLRAFVDRDEDPIGTAFKLYPWEWMVREPFGESLLANTTRWLEPPWKMILSNRALLPVLASMFPDSPYVLPAGFEPFGDSFVAKPIFSREGANISMVSQGRKIAETGGPYAGGPCIYQELHPLPDFGGNFPVIGSWVVNGHACGLGIREDRSPITQNTSRFVPHVFRR